MKKIIMIIAAAIVFLGVQADENRVMKVYKNGALWYQFAISDIDSMTYRDMRASDDIRQIVLKSKLCSEILLAEGSDGSMTYLDGAKISELGHWLMYDDPETLGDEGCNTDTIFASFNPPSSDFTVDWTIGNPNVLEIVAQSAAENYIVVRAKKLGSTTITASVEDVSATVNTTVTNHYVTKMDGWDSNAEKVKVGYLTESYTIFLSSEDPNSTRLSQKVWMKMDKKNNEVKAPITWSVSEDGIVYLDLKEGKQNLDGTWMPDSCVIRPLREGTVTITAQCQYRTVEMLVTVLGGMRPVSIDSLQFVDINNKSYLEKLWLSRGEQSLVEVLCYPNNALIYYNNGYTWNALNPDIATVESFGYEDNIRIIEGKKAGTGQVSVSLGTGEYMKTDVIDVQVCPAILAGEFTISAPSGYTLTEINEGVSIQLENSIVIPIKDQVLVDEGYIQISWYCDAPEEFVTIDKTTGILTAHKDMGSDNCKVWAEITYPKYLGRAGYEYEMVTTKSNELICKVVKQVSIGLNFTPVSVTYTIFEDPDYGTIYEPVFKDGEGNTLELFPNYGLLEYEFGTTISLDAVNYKITYKGNEFTSGICSFSLSGDQATYTFSNVKASGGTGVDINLVVTPPSGTLPAARE